VTKSTYDTVESGRGRDRMQKLLMAVIFVFAFGTMAIASDIAFYVGAFQPGSYDQRTMTNDVEKIIKDAGALFNDIQKFDDKELDAFGRWADRNTGDGDFDIIWLNGQIPSTLYPTFNKKPDGSRAEKWLDDGNMFINVADWFAWATHENGEKERNMDAGAANILDLPENIIVGQDSTLMKATAAGKKFIPSLGNQYISNRPVNLRALAAPWEAAEIFAEKGNLVDPVVLHNTKTDGYLAIISQSKLENMGDRGAVCSEFINNWVVDEVRLLPVEPAGKLTTTWGSIKGE